MPYGSFAALPLALLSLLTATTAAAQPGMVVLVRHAEKAAAPAVDPALSEAGEKRARALAATLADTRIGSVITTQFQRTQATGAPVAAALGLTAITVPATGDAKGHVQAVADAVKARPKGEAVLVVGHSNTIPAIVHALGGPALPDLCEGEYDQLFILSFDEGSPPKLVRARFGSPDDPNAPPCTRTMRQ